MKKKVFTNQVDAELLKNFKKLAIDLDRPLNNVLEEAMRNLLKNHEKPKARKDKDAGSSPTLPF
jgi:predicted transcriptional regulator